MHTSYLRFSTVNHELKHLGQDSNRQPQRLKASTLTTKPLSPLSTHSEDTHEKSMESRYIQSNTQENSHKGSLLPSVIT